jgi:hypothetical protein
MGEKQRQISLANIKANKKLTLMDRTFGKTNSRNREGILRLIQTIEPSQINERRSCVSMKARSKLINIFDK